MATTEKKAKTATAKIEHPCGCLIHVNGPGQFASICHHYCKQHGEIMQQMKTLVAERNKP